MENQNNKKYRDLEFGKFAEDKAAEYYISKGYAILKRNWRLKKIEIDVIAQSGNVIAFIEVKARSGKDAEAIEAVTLDKMKRMARGADIFLSSLEEDYEYRFDIFALTGDFNNYKVEIVKDAFISPLLR